MWQHSSTLLQHQDNVLFARKPRHWAFFFNSTTTDSWHLLLPFFVIFIYSPLCFPMITLILLSEFLICPLTNWFPSVSLWFLLHLKWSILFQFNRALKSWNCLVEVVRGIILSLLSQACYRCTPSGLLHMEHLLRLQVDTPASGTAWSAYGF